MNKWLLTISQRKKKVPWRLKKFYNFYQSIGWKLNGKNPITNWQACAQNWMIKVDEMKNDQNFKPPSHNRDSLCTSKNKNYGEPL